jgi:hypothetical protein
MPNQKGLNNDTKMRIIYFKFIALIIINIIIISTVIAQQSDDEYKDALIEELSKKQKLQEAEDKKVDEVPILRERERIQESISEKIRANQEKSGDISSVDYNGKTYYVVKSTIPSLDSGDEVCAAVGKECVGYNFKTQHVCKKIHPNANVVMSYSGDLTGTYCDGAPQNEICSSLRDTCLVCPACTNSVTCYQSIAGLYREMYVECKDKTEEVYITDSAKPKSRCPIIIKADSTKEFLNDIPSYNQQMQGCPIELKGFAGTLIGNGNLQFELTMDDGTTKNIFFEVKQNQVTGIKEGTAAFNFILRTGEQEADRLLQADDIYQTFLRLLKYDNIKLAGGSFGARIKLMLFKAISLFQFKEEQPAIDEDIQIVYGDTGESSTQTGLWGNLLNIKIFPPKETKVNDKVIIKALVTHKTKGHADRFDSLPSLSTTQPLGDILSPNEKIIRTDYPDIKFEKSAELINDEFTCIKDGQIDVEWTIFVGGRVDVFIGDSAISAKKTFKIPVKCVWKQETIQEDSNLQKDEGQPDNAVKVGSDTISWEHEVDLDSIGTIVIEAFNPPISFVGLPLKLDGNVKFKKDDSADKTVNKVLLYREPPPFVSRGVPFPYEIEIDDDIGNDKRGYEFNFIDAKCLAKGQGEYIYKFEVIADGEVVKVIEKSVNVYCVDNIEELEKIRIGEDLHLKISKDKVIRPGHIVTAIATPPVATKVNDQLEFTINIIHTEEPPLDTLEGPINVNWILNGADIISPYVEVIKPDSYSLSPYTSLTLTSKDFTCRHYGTGIITVNLDFSGEVIYPNAVPVVKRPYEDRIVLNIPFTCVKEQDTSTEVSIGSTAEPQEVLKGDNLREVPTLVLYNLHYALSQFILANIEYGCEYKHWHAVGKVKNLESEVVELEDPDPHGCGFGTEDEVKTGSKFVEKKNPYQPFCGDGILGGKEECESHKTCLDNYDQTFACINCFCIKTFAQDISLVAIEKEPDVLCTYNECQSSSECIDKLGDYAYCSIDCRCEVFDKTQEGLTIEHMTDYAVELCEFSDPQLAEECTNSYWCKAIFGNEAYCSTDCKCRGY